MVGRRLFTLALAVLTLAVWSPAAEAATKNIRSSIKLNRFTEQGDLIGAVQSRSERCLRDREIRASSDSGQTFLYRSNRRGTFVIDLDTLGTLLPIGSGVSELDLQLTRGPTFGEENRKRCGGSTEAVAASTGTSSIASFFYEDVNSRFAGQLGDDVSGCSQQNRVQLVRSGGDELVATTFSSESGTFEFDLAGPASSGSYYTRVGDWFTLEAGPDPVITYCELSFSDPVVVE